MTNPDQDDDWAELARELERDAPPPASQHSPPGSDEVVSEVAEPDADDEFDDAEAGEAEEAGSEEATEGELAPGEQPGTGRKRRRRRRRRRKGGAGQPADATAEVAVPEPAEDAEVAETESETESEITDEEVEVEYEEAIVADSEADAAEDAGGELLRELIANWNVPSWDDIVTGLYRPDR